MEEELLAPVRPSGAPPSRTEVNKYTRWQSRKLAGRLAASSKAVGFLRAGNLTAQYVYRDMSSGLWNNSRLFALPLRYNKAQSSSMLVHEADQRVLTLWGNLASSKKPHTISNAARERGYCSANGNDESIARKIISKHWELGLPSGVYASCQGFDIEFQVTKASRGATIAFVVQKDTTNVVARHYVLGMSGRDKDFRIEHTEGIMQALFVHDGWCPHQVGAVRASCDMLDIFKEGMVQDIDEQPGLRTVSSLPGVELATMAVRIKGGQHPMVGLGVSIVPEIEKTFKYRQGTELCVYFEETWQFATVTKSVRGELLNKYVLRFKDEVVENSFRSATIELAIGNHFVFNEGFTEMVSKLAPGEKRTVESYILSQRLWQLSQIKLPAARVYMTKDRKEVDGTQPFLEECTKLFDGHTPELNEDENGQACVTKENLDEFLQQTEFTGTLKVVVKAFYSGPRGQFAEPFHQVISRQRVDVDELNMQHNKHMLLRKRTFFRIDEKLMIDEDQCKVTEQQRWLSLQHDKYGTLLLKKAKLTTTARIESRRKRSWFSSQQVDEFFEDKWANLTDWTVGLELPHGATMELDCLVPPSNRLQHRTLQLDPVIKFRVRPVSRNDAELHYVNVPGQDLDLQKVQMQSVKVQTVWKSVMCCHDRQRVALPAENGAVETAIVVGNVGAAYMYRGGAAKAQDSENGAKWNIPRIRMLKQVVLPAQSYRYTEGEMICLRTQLTPDWADCRVIKCSDKETNEYELKVDHVTGVDQVKISLHEGNHFPTVTNKVKLQADYRQVLLLLQNQSTSVTDMLTRNNVDTATQHIRLHMTSAFKAGDIVRVIELRSHRHFNGQTAALISRNECRWRVRLVDSGEEHEFFEKNLLRSDGTIGTGVSLSNVDDLVAHAMPPADEDSYEKAALAGNITWAKYLHLPSQKLKTTAHQRPILVTSPTGSGKTWMAQQFVNTMSKKLLSPEIHMQRNHAFRIPLLLPIQKIAKAIKARRHQVVTQQGEAKADSQNLMYPPALNIEFLVRTKIRDFPALKRKRFAAVLRRAFATRKVVVILDGIDEASELCEPMILFIRDTLLPGGHQVICTARHIPSQYRAVFESTGWYKISLKKVSDEDRMIGMRQQTTDSPFITNLFTYIDQVQWCDQLYSSFPDKALVEDIDDVMEEVTESETVTTIRALRHCAAAARKTLKRDLEEFVDRVGLDSASPSHLTVSAIESTQDSLLRIAELAINSNSAAEDVAGTALKEDQVKGDGEQVAVDTVEGDGEQVTVDTEVEGLSTVTDMLCATIVCAQARQIRDIVSLIHYAYDLEIVTLHNGLRTKSTHTRCLQLKVRVTLRTAQGNITGTHVASVVIHHQGILENAPSNTVYEYLRRHFVSSAMEMDTSMVLYQKICRNEVLVSLLIVALESDPASPPSSIAKLYDAAIGSVLSKQAKTAVSAVTVLRGEHQDKIAQLGRPESELMSETKYQVFLGEHLAEARILGEDLRMDTATELSNGWNALKQVAAYIHLCLHQVTFGHDDVTRALSQRQLQQYWSNLARIPARGTLDGIPCYKMLDVDSVDETYMAYDLSVQEYLAASFFYDFLRNRQGQLPAANTKFKEGSLYNTFHWFESASTKVQVLNDKWNFGFLSFVHDFQDATSLMFPRAVMEFNCTKPTISVEGLKACACFFDSTKELRLMHQKLDGAKIKLLARLLTMGCSILQVLDLSNNDSGVEGAHALALFLPLSNISTLNLSSNSLCALCGGKEEYEHDISGITVLARALRANNTVTSLDISHNNLRSAGAAAITRVLANNKTLEAFSLAGNHIQVTGCIDVATMLSLNTSIKTLNLNANEMTGLDPYSPDFRAFAALHDALEVNETLISLDISSNRICGMYEEKGDGFQTGTYDPAGLISLVDALKVNKSLRTLSIANNNIGLSGLHHLVEMFKLNVPLSELDISFNGIGPEGHGYIAENHGGALKIFKTSDF